MILSAYISFLINTPLFFDIEHSEAETLLTCLDADVLYYSAGEEMLTTNTTEEDGFVLLSGQAKQIRRSIPREGIKSVENGENSKESGLQICIIEPGDLYGLNLSESEEADNGVAVVANTHCAVLRFPYETVPAFCTNACPAHKLFIDNLFRLLIAQRKRLSLHNEVLSKHGIREKLLTYLRMHQTAVGETFTIPYNREKLSEHLGVDRSALSRELSNLQAEGVLTFKRSEFKLNQ